jgi:F-type H+-transporting ATPase subunit b
MVSLTIDWTFLIQMANFLLLILALNYVFFKPLRKLMGSRQELVDGLKANADVAMAQLAEGEAKRERFRVEVLQEGVKLHAGLRDEGRSQEAGILAETQREAADRLESAREAIGVQVEKARQELRAEAAILASELANKLLGRDAEAGN